MQKYFTKIIILLPVFIFSLFAEDIEFTNPYKLFHSVDKSFMSAGIPLSRSSGVIEKSQYMATSTIPVGKEFGKVELEILVEKILEKFNNDVQGIPHQVSLTSNKSPSNEENGITYFDLIIKCPEYDLFMSGSLLPNHLVATLVHLPKE